MVLSAFLLLHPAYAQQPDPGSSEGATSFNGLFTAHPGAPAQGGDEIPPSSAFFRIDPAAFDRLAQLPGSSVTIEGVRLPGGTAGTLQLRRFSVLAPGGAVVAGTQTGDRPAELPQSIFLSGTVTEIPGSFVYLAIFRDYCSGYIDLPASDDGTSRRITFAPLSISDGMPSVMVAYNEREALQASERKTGQSPWHWECGAEELPEYEQGITRSFKEYGHSRATGKSLQSNTPLVAQMAIDCDAEYYAAHGRSLARSVTYALTVTGAVSAIYQRDLNVALQVSYLRVWTGTDPYPGTTSSTLLGQMRNYWSNNMGTVNRSVAHLFSTKSIGGGIAYVNTLCAPASGYAAIGLGNNIVFPSTSYAWDVDVVSHELGHNFGSAHTHSCAWAPAIDSCYAAESGNCFSSTKPRVGSIMSYCHLTQFGTQLYFHPRVAAFIRSKAEAYPCVVPLETSMTHDVAAIGITVPVPGGKVVTGTQFTPTASFKNTGTVAQILVPVTFVIRDSAGAKLYDNTRTIPVLEPGASVTVAFASTSIQTVARCNASVTTTPLTDGNPQNNTLVRPFETVASSAASVTLLSPNNFTVLRSGSTTTIAWNYTGSITALRIDFSSDDGMTWQTVKTELTPNTGGKIHTWTVPAVATTRGRIRISDRDNASVADQSEQAFTVVTLPLEWQWARSIGGGMQDDARGVAIDRDDNVYITGTFSDSIRLGATRMASRGSSDIYLAKYNAGGTLQWARQIGGIGPDSATGMALDAAGNAYLVGGFSGSITIGSTALSSAGGTDAFIAKYDPNGTPLWGNRGGGGSADMAHGVAVDTNGNVLATGMFTGSASFGTGSLVSAGGSDIFVVRYNPAGTFSWSARLGGAEDDAGNGIAADIFGGSYVAGRFRGTMSVGSGTIRSAGGDDAFLAKLNPNGTTAWGAVAGGSQNDEATAVVVDKGANATMAGSLAGTVNFGNFFASSSGGRDMFIARYNAVGTVQWARTAGGSGDDEATELAIDAFGNCYVAGTFRNQFTIAQLGLNSLGGSDIFFAKYGTDGLVQWARRGGGARDEVAGGIAIAANGENGFVVGRYGFAPPSDQPSIYGDDRLGGAGMSDGMVARIGMFKTVTPSEGEILVAGTPRNITWTGTTATNVRIEYSADNGTTWATLAGTAPNNGVYNWMPDTPSAQALIRVSDADNPSVYGEAQSGTFAVISSSPATVAPAVNLHGTALQGSAYLIWEPSSSQEITGYALYRGMNGEEVTRIATVEKDVLEYTDRSVTLCTDYFYHVRALVDQRESFPSNTAQVYAAPAKPEVIRQPATSILGSSVEGEAYKWFRNGEEIAGATERSFTANLDGTYTVMVFSGTGCSVLSDPLPVRIASGVTGSSRIAESVLVLQPNPTAGTFMVELELPEPGELRLIVRDLAGREVLRAGEVHARGTYRRELDITSLPSGIYLLEIHAGKTVWNQKVVKQ